jgi:hypothetical protein
VDWADFPRAAEIIAAGRTAAEDSLPKLRAELERAASFGAGLRRRIDRTLRKGGLIRKRRPVALTVEAADVPQPELPEEEDGPPAAELPPTAD